MEFDQRPKDGQQTASGTTVKFFSLETSLNTRVPMQSAAALVLVSGRKHHGMNWVGETITVSLTERNFLWDYL